MTTGPKTIRTARRGMLCLAAAHPLSPELERRRFQVLPHHTNHLRLGKSELKFNCLEGGAVLPGHLNNPIQIFAGRSCQRGANEEARR